jgi:hypothetical protein
MSKETYYSVKRDLLQCQKTEEDRGRQRKTEEDRGRQELLCQKRPTTVSKETYYSVKRDLLQCHTKEDSNCYYVFVECSAHGIKQVTARSLQNVFSTN